ncbi:hypothetical protein JRO89_XS04G0215500 [Xanthoceras sorbifolium]|uniref:CCHC-type domain-containing protein n=1 Tax=Xanthoceras sorbifolium TaxID=99658 RepID=A0ABQ8I6C7_9ROSI|nr:hypothetical protein JRO89_XS04G0215500 [Xanthoceras sorbifolium]
MDTDEIPSGYGDFSEMKFCWSDFWIQIHNASLVCMTKSVGLLLEQQIGKVKDIDVGASRDYLGKFLRIRVSVDVSKALKRILRIKMDGMREEKTLLIKYERLPEYCFECGHLGHSYRECPAVFRGHQNGGQREVANKDASTLLSMNRASHAGLGHDVVAEGLNSGRLSAPKLRIMTAAVKGKEINKDTLHDEGRDSCDLIAVNNRELIGALEIIPSLALNCMEFTPKMVHSQTSNKPMQQVRVSSKAPNNSPLSESRVKDYGAEELGQLKDGGPSLRQMSPNTDSMGRTDSRLKQVGGQLNSLIFLANGTESTHSERPPDASKKEEVGPVFVFTSSINTLDDFLHLRHSIAEKRRILQTLNEAVSASSWQQIKSIEKELDTLLYKEKIYWRQHSRNSWLKGGDKNTRSFHMAASKRKARNCIGGFRNSDNIWVTSKGRMTVFNRESLGL